MHDLPSVYFSYEDVFLLVRNRLDDCINLPNGLSAVDAFSQVVTLLYLVNHAIEKFSFFVGVRKDGRVFVFPGVSDEATFQIHIFQLL